MAGYGRRWGRGIPARPFISKSVVQSVQIADSDTGSGLDEVSTLTASLTQADTGTAADTGAVAATLTGTDTGSGADTAGTITFTAADTGSGADAEAVAVTAADTGSGLDAAGTTAFSAADTGTGTEQTGVTAFSAADTGSGLDDQANPFVTVSGTDTGSGVDAQTAPAVTVESADTGSGVDAGAASNSLSDTDTGTAADAGTAPPATFSQADTGSAVDAETVPPATLAAADTGSGADIAASIAQTEADAGSGADAAASIAQTQADTGSALDEEVFPTFADADTGSAVDTGTISVTGTDTGTGTDNAPSIAVTDSDTGTVVDQHAALTPSAADTGSGVDAAAVPPATLSSNDPVNATEAASFDNAAADTGSSTDELALIQLDSTPGSAENPDNALGVPDAIYTTNTGAENWTHTWYVDEFPTSVTMVDAQEFVIHLRKDATGGADPSIISASFFMETGDGVYTKYPLIGITSVNDSTATLTGFLDASEFDAAFAMDQHYIEIDVASAGEGVDARTIQVDAVEWIASTVEGTFAVIFNADTISSAEGQLVTIPGEGEAENPDNALFAPDGIYTTNTGDESWTHTWYVDEVEAGQALTGTQEFVIHLRKDAAGGADPSIVSVSFFMETGDGTYTEFPLIGITTVTDSTVSLSGFMDASDFNAAFAMDQHYIEVDVAAAGSGGTARTVQVDAITWIAQTVSGSFAPSDDDDSTATDQVVTVGVLPEETDLSLVADLEALDVVPVEDTGTLLDEHGFPDAEVIEDDPAIATEVEALEVQLTTDIGTAVDSVSHIAFEFAPNDTGSGIEASELQPIGTDTGSGADSATTIFLSDNDSATMVETLGETPVGTVFLDPDVATAAETSFIAVTFTAADTVSLFDDHLLDPGVPRERGLQILPEDRTYRIPAEERVMTILAPVEYRPPVIPRVQENRVLEIEAEDRTYSIDPDDRVVRVLPNRQRPPQPVRPEPSRVYFVEAERRTAVVVGSVG